MKLMHLGAAIVLLVSTGSAAVAQTNGETLFKQRCGVCHTTTPGPSKMGPALNGVVGRKSGSSPGFAYSDAMKKAAIRWDAASLDKYLAAPAKAVPGTKMMIAVPNAEQRAAIVAYLATQK